MPVWMPCSHVSSGDVAHLVSAVIGVGLSTSLSVAAVGVVKSATVSDVVFCSSSVVNPLPSVGVVECSSAGGAVICSPVGVVAVRSPSAVDTLASVGVVMYISQSERKYLV